MRLLLAGATLSFTAAASHAGIAVSHATDAYTHALAAGAFAISPAFMTMMITALFMVWGLYAMSASGAIAPLPLIQPAIYAITAIYLTRGMFLLPQLMGYNIFTAGEPVTGSDMLISAVVLAIGAIHMAGVTQRDL